MEKNIKNKYLSLILLLFIFLGTVSFFTVSGKEEDEVAACASENDAFKRYKCEVKKLCKKTEYGKNKTKIANPEKDYEKDMDLKKAKKLYVKHQNQIYNCGILTSKERAYKDTLGEEVKTTDKSGKLKSKILPKIDQKVGKIQGLKSKNKCNNIDKKKAPKKVTNDQAKMEECKYKFFLDYLQNKKNDEFDEKTLKGQDFLSNKEVEDDIEKFKEKIKDEKERAADIQDKAQYSYSQYDNNFKQEVMLKEGMLPAYEQYARSLYQSSHPISQFGYKAINTQQP